MQLWISVVNLQSWLQMNTENYNFFLKQKISGARKGIYSKYFVLKIKNTQLILMQNNFVIIIIFLSTYSGKLQFLS